MPQCWEWATVTDSSSGKYIPAQSTILPLIASLARAAVRFAVNSVYLIRAPNAKAAFSPANIHFSKQQLQSEFSSCSPLARARAKINANWIHSVQPPRRRQKVSIMHNTLEKRSASRTHSLSARGFVNVATRAEFFSVTRVAPCIFCAAFLWLTAFVSTHRKRAFMKGI